MKEKSKFITFILSFIPGLSHLYLGYMDRGFIYLIIFGMICVGSVGMTIITNAEVFLALLIGVPIIWLIALLDAFSTINTIRYGNRQEIKENWNSEETKISNKKIITLALSMIPGAGHMYLGYQNKGLVYMGGFFFTIFFMGWLNLSFLLFLLPLIWFYSFFDAFHTINGSNVEDMDITRILPNLKHEYLGVGLIIIGAIIVLQKVFYPLVEQALSPILQIYMVRQIRNYIQASIVSLIFILGGIRILRGNRKIKYLELEGDVENED